MNRYILEGETPIICDDECRWREFMRDGRNILVARDEVGKFTVVTVFLGFNHGTEEKPKFFQTTCFGADNPMPKYSKDWHWAMLQHRGKIACAEGLIKFSAERAAGIDRSFKFVDWKIYPDELHFVLASEADAERAMPVNKKHWERRGRTIVFLVRPAD